MGNSPSSGQGGSELHERRDIDGTDFKNERLPKFKDVAGAKTKTNDYESLNSNPLQCRPSMGHERDARASAEEIRAERAERPVSQRKFEIPVFPEVLSMGDGETKSTLVVHRRGLWDEHETAVHLYGRRERRRSGVAEGVNPLVSGIHSGSGEEVHLSSGMTQSANSPLYSNEADCR